MNVLSLNKILDLIFPQKCIYCDGEREEGGPFLCDICAGDVVFMTRPFCNRCGWPAETSYDYPGDEFECGPCRKQPPYFDQARSLGVYETVLKQLIHHFKYGKQPGVMEEIAPLLQTYFSGWNETGLLVVPVPLHIRKLKERGFDQSYLIARHIAMLTGLSLRANALTRVRETEPQARKNKEDRRKNVRGVFGVNWPEEWRGKNILLVDDVLTTGATANEAARVFKKAKASRVLVFTLARA